MWSITQVQRRYLANPQNTGIIGVHPIFGAFLAGLICPHEGGFAIKLTEKIEDLISVLFLPLYFALSGLSTDLGLLDDGMTWAYVFGVIAIAFSGKIIGGTLAARLSKLEWRESFTIGCLMSCKGLVELIVLVSPRSQAGRRIGGSMKTCLLADNHNPRTSDSKPGSFPGVLLPSSSSWQL